MAQLICYDIEDNKVREKVAKLLVRSGFTRIQLSVFAGNLRHEKCLAVYEKIKAKWADEHPSDKFCLCFIDDTNLESGHQLAHQPEWEMILGRVKYKIF